MAFVGAAAAPMVASKVAPALPRMSTLPIVLEPADRPTFHVPDWAAWTANVPALVTAMVVLLKATVPLTGCVACQKVPLTGWVVWKNVPDTGCVACQKVPVTGVLGMEAMLTGWGACQNVTETGTVPRGGVRSEEHTSE